MRPLLDRLTHPGALHGREDATPSGEGVKLVGGRRVLTAHRHPMVTPVFMAERQNNGGRP
jgi:hypothetical protein